MLWNSQCTLRLLHEVNMAASWNANEKWKNSWILTRFRWQPDSNRLVVTLFNILAKFTLHAILLMLLFLFTKNLVLIVTIGQESTIVTQLIFKAQLPMCCTTWLVLLCESTQVLRQKILACKTGSIDYQSRHRLSCLRKPRLSLCHLNKTCKILDVPEFHVL